MSVDAALQGACTCKPCAISSTYCLVAASVDAVGVATDVILWFVTSTLPVPLGVNTISSFVPAALIVRLPVGAVIVSVTKLPVVV